MNIQFFVKVKILSNQIKPTSVEQTSHESLFQHMTYLK